jgi:hypothetical protein
MSDDTERFVQRVALILWPSFIVGGIGTVCFFSLFDPAMLPFSETLLPFSDSTLGQNRMLVYSVGFVLFWLFAAASSWLTCFLARSPGEVNRASLAAGPEENARSEEKLGGT